VKSEKAGGAAPLCFALFTFRVAAHIAQSAEHFLGKEEVTGSIPVMGSIMKPVI
jgi:hypothetical protein